MFTGIIQARGEARLAKQAGKNRAVQITLPRGWKLKLGESVSVDGICSTVARLGKGFFGVDYIPETLRLTTAGAFSKGSLVNLERALRFGDSIGGHLVQGHIDGCGVVEALSRASGERRLAVRAPAPLARRIQKKGSVAINGVSLTVAEKRGNRFVVALIPHTLDATNLGNLKAGDAVNIEVDRLAKRPA